MGLMNFGGQKNRSLHEHTGLISDASFVVIDSELTGLNERKDSIVSLGAVRMTGARIAIGETFYRLIKPKAALTRESVIIHGITPSEVADERDSSSVLEEFAVFCGNRIIVGHCVAIDFEFIDREMRRVLGARLKNQILDTAALFTWMACRNVLQRCTENPPREPELYRLAQCLDISVSEAHHALMDAYVTAQVFQRFLPLLIEEGISTIGDLVRIGDPLGGGDRFRSTGEIGSL
jgi:DNA polymerase-3 subunit epsilon